MFFTNHIAPSHATSEVQGGEVPVDPPGTGKSFRFVRACVRACERACVRASRARSESVCEAWFSLIFGRVGSHLPFSLFGSGAFPFSLPGFCPFPFLELASKEFQANFQVSSHSEIK